jgi:hypothetical protein
VRSGGTCGGARLELLVVVDVGERNQIGLERRETADPKIGLKVDDDLHVLLRQAGVGRRVRRRRRRQWRRRWGLAQLDARELNVVGPADEERVVGEPLERAAVEVGARRATRTGDVGDALGGVGVVDLDADVVGPGDEFGAPDNLVDGALARVDDGVFGAKEALGVEEQLALAAAAAEGARGLGGVVGVELESEHGTRVGDDDAFVRVERGDDDAAVVRGGAEPLARRVDRDGVDGGGVLGEALDFVAVEVEHVHDARVRAEGDESRVHGNARRRVALQNLAHIATDTLVFQLRFEFFNWFISIIEI